MWPNLQDFVCLLKFDLDVKQTDSRKTDIKSYNYKVINSLIHKGGKEMIQRCTDQKITLYGPIWNNLLNGRESVMNIAIDGSTFPI